MVFIFYNSKLFLPFPYFQTPIQTNPSLLTNLDWFQMTIRQVIGVEIERYYRVSHLLADLGWVDLDLGSSPGWLAIAVAIFCPSRMVEHPKSKSTQPRFVRRWDTLYLKCTLSSTKLKQKSFFGLC